jgi:catechol-2,3-dioxygenase
MQTGKNRDGYHVQETKFYEKQVSSKKNKGYGPGEEYMSTGEYHGYMETVPKIKVYPHLSEKNSEKMEESVMNQSNYKVNIDVNDTFGNPKRYNLNGFN